MQWHIEQAARAGASQQEVLEAVEVAMEMGAGPATAHARFALAVMADVVQHERDTYPSCGARRALDRHAAPV
jgi:alkylhydroperoxidase/carboxymuconolactone decarboxylase family protein YurZ